MMRPRPGVQELQPPTGAFETVGLCVAPHHDGGSLGQGHDLLIEVMRRRWSGTGALNSVGTRARRRGWRGPRGRLRP